MVMIYYVLDVETGDVVCVAESYDEAERKALHLQRIRAEHGLYFEYEIGKQEESPHDRH